MIDAAPKNWTACQTVGGLQIEYAPRSAPGLWIAWAFIAGLVGLCGYGASTFALGWLRGEEVLVAGVVLFLLALGGVLLGLCFAAGLLRTTTYVLGADSLSISMHRPVFGERLQEIAKRQITGVVRVHTPSKVNGVEDTWRTLLVVGNPGGPGEKNVSLEGDREADSAWLSSIVAQWAGVETRVERNP